MCVVSIAWEAHPRWKLIAIGNRDEFHDRASEPLSSWVDAPSILAGRDVLADKDGLTHIANRPHAVQERWPRGIYGLSNAETGAPWPRKDRLNRALTVWFAAEGHDPTDLFDVLLDDQSPASGDPPIFIRNAVYGTRCSTLVAVDSDGGGCIMERRFDREGNFARARRFTFDWPI